VAFRLPPIVISRVQRRTPKGIAMSTPPPAPGADPAADAVSIRHIRALFQRKLIDRARTVADARWPGSGQMVSLASEWSALSPAERRARLSKIGPEDLARLRALAELNPDLARVLDDLEKRGVLPPALFTAQPGVVTDEALVDTALNLGEAAVRELAAQAEGATAAGITPTTPHTAAPLLEPLPQTEMPVLDLGLPTTDQFLASEAERRAAAAVAASAVLDRIRQRVDDHADRLTSPSAGTMVTPLPARDAVADSESHFADTLDEVDISTPDDAARSDVDLSDLMERIRDDQIVVLAEDDRIPSTGGLTALASALELPLVEIELRAGELRAAFGGLRRRGPEYIVEAGPLPVALATANLVVVRGSIYPSMLGRWRQGFCDILGTRASTLINPKCRVLVIDGRV